MENSNIKYDAGNNSVGQIWVGIATITIMLAFAGFLLIKEVNFLRAATYQIMIAVIGCSIISILRDGIKDYFYKIITPFYWLRGGLAILIMGIIYVFGLYFFISDRRNRRIYTYFTTAGRLIAWSFGASVVLEGLEKVDKEQQYIVVCNHTSFIDYFISTAILGSLFRRYTVVYGSNLEKQWPVFGWILKRWFISVDRTSREDQVLCYRKMSRALSEGKNLLIFPEGKRMQKSEISTLTLNELSLSPFSLAISTKIQVLPVVIHARTFCPKFQWFIRPQKIKVHFLTPVLVTGYEKKEDIRNYVSSMMKCEINNKNCASCTNSTCHNKK